MRAMLEETYPVKCGGRLGGGPDDDKVIRILNRVVEWREEGIVVEADRRHAELAVQLMGLVGRNGSEVPGAKEKVDPEGGEGGNSIRIGGGCIERWRRG